MATSKKNILVLFIVLLIVLIGAVLLLPSNDYSFDDLVSRDVIRIGFAVEAPFAFISDNGTVTGESPELAKFIVSQLGISRIEWKLVEFNALIDELQKGKIDVIAAGMFINAERAQEVAFSEPTFYVQPSLLVQKGNPYKIHSYVDALVRSEFKMAVVDGAIEEHLLLQLGFDPSRLIKVPDAFLGRKAVEAGLAHGLALSKPTIGWMLIGDGLGTTEAALPFEVPAIYNKQKNGFGAFVFRKSDKQLLQKWNSVLATLVASEKHLSIVAPFGFGANEMPSNVKLNEIITP